MGAATEVSTDAFFALKEERGTLLKAFPLSKSRFVSSLAEVVRHAGRHGGGGARLVSSQCRQEAMQLLLPGL